MSEEEKQYRADNCSPEQFNQLVDELAEKAIELYSIADRVPSLTLVTFINEEGEDGHTWSKIDVAMTYIATLKAKAQAVRR